MDRRDFLKLSLAGAAILPLPRLWTPAQASAGRDKYSIVILGDTHYDDADPLRYHSGYADPKPKRDALHRQEFARNGEMWAGRCRSLVKRAACLVDDDTRLVLQMGDLIQGDTADAATHKRFLEDAMNLFKDSLAPNLPFVTVVGNHDIRGNDDAVCRQAYKEYMTVRMGEELGREIDDVNFLFRVGPDTFVVVDFNKPRTDSIKALLEEARGARHVFLITHGPAIPVGDEYYYWFLLGSKKDKYAVQRRELRALLASMNAIVLCGHTHTTEFLDWKGDGGRITQMIMNSVWSSADKGSYKVIASGADGYGNEEGKVLFDEYRPGIRSYSKSEAAGSYKLTVDGPKVTVDFYAGDSARRSERFVLR